MEFIDRERELSFLEERWREPKAQFVVLWGKRRVGKTELVKQFVSDKPHIYFLAESTSEKEQLHRFSQAVGRFFNEPLLETRGFAGWEECFRYVKAKNERLVLTIDEFPYLIGSIPGIVSLFQKAWDEFWCTSRVFLLLLGSNTAMMENEILSYRSPLYGRRTGQWRVDPMSFSAAGLFRKGKPFADRLAHYSLAGGVPAYWLQLDPEKGFAENLKSRVLKKGAMLYDEVEFILREELREPRYYFALLQAIAQGKRKLSEIVNATGLNHPVANKYLGVLADLKIVERETPVTEDKPLKSKKGLYRIAEQFFGFWFRFVFPKRGELEMERIEEALASIQQDLSHHFAGTYERVAMETVWRHMQGLFPFNAAGRWWDRNEEIDIVAFNSELNSILFGEVKWSEKPVGKDIYKALQEKAIKVKWGRKQRKEFYCLFSKSGFTDAMIRKAKEEGIVLFKGDEVLEMK